MKEQSTSPHRIIHFHRTTQHRFAALVFILLLILITPPPAPGAGVTSVQGIPEIQVVGHEIKKDQNASGPSAARQPSGYHRQTLYSDISLIANQVLQAQVPGGGICNNVAQRRGPRAFMDTYCFGGLALEKAFQMTGNLKYLVAAKNFVQFWMKHQNMQPDRWGVPGTFYGQTYLGQRHVCAFIYHDKGPNAGGPGYDASDADPPFVLQTAYRYYILTGDKVFLTRYEKNFELIGAAMSATLQSSGLTWAHPNYHAAYLMDVAEVWIGYADLSHIFTWLGHPQKAAKYARLAARVRKGILTLWNKKAHCYFWAKFPDGFHQPCNWSHLYPDALEQLWPALWSAVRPTSTESKLTWSEFQTHYPNWTDQLSWPCIGYVAILMGDPADARVQAVKILAGKGTDPRWYVNNMYFTLLDCCEPFNVEGGAHIIYDTVRMFYRRLTMNVRSSGVVLPRIRLLPPRGTHVVATINGQACEVAMQKPWSFIFPPMNGQRTDQVSIRFVKP